MVGTTLSKTSSTSVVNNLEVRVGNCMVSIDFYVLGMENSSMPPFSGKKVLATMDAIADMQRNSVIRKY